MNNIGSYLPQVNFVLLAMLFGSFLVKIILYYRVEKEWDPVRFLHYSKSDLKMTVSKDLRVWRKRQNVLTSFFVVLMLLSLFAYLFYKLIAIN